MYKLESCYQSIRSFLAQMTRRSHSPELSPRPQKKVKLDHLTSQDYKNGVFLAPMVRSGALPTRLFALKHGATMVWGPEMVDKAILHSKREVDPLTGIISYNGVSRAIFTTHPIEKPYFIYQLGSADPELAVQAAKTVMQDISGIDLNCGCPKPFSTHAGMGAALLTNPDLLCSILVALRKAMPPEITVSAKIRLLPSQEDTLKLVERICGTGISALTVHCRTRNMRDRERAMIERLREIVQFVEKLGKGIAVVENGDCQGWEDAKRVREVTGAHSVMIARAAEANPTCFADKPLIDLDKTLVPSYLRLSKYLDHNWGLTKFCVNQFKGDRVKIKKADSTQVRQKLSQAKGFDAISELVNNEWTGEDEMKQIVEAIEKNPPRLRRMYITPSITSTIDTTESNVSTSISPTALEMAKLRASATPSLDTHLDTVTPQNTQNPEPPSSGAPLLPMNFTNTDSPLALPVGDPVTPTPTPGVTA